MENLTFWPTDPPPEPPVRCLSVNAYWAWAIRHGYKRIENRTWRTHHRGPLLIHAAKKTTRDAEARGELQANLGRVPDKADIAGLRGCLIARCTLYDVRTVDDPPPGLVYWDRLWVRGPYLWILGDCAPIPPVPVRGQQGLFLFRP